MLTALKLILKRQLRRALSRILLHQYLLVGDEHRLHLAATAVVNNAFFNLYSGSITIEDHVFFGYNVCLLTGTHDYLKFGVERQMAVDRSGRDIVIGQGAWIGTNATIIGPCTIGEHAVVAAGAVVRGTVLPYTIVGGVPARTIKDIPRS